jgi:GT2 family glycosyltransferase
VLQDPALVPASALLRRDVYAAIGGFDETLVTGEDLDFHLRIARRWPIGVVAQPLVRALRGHDGLSSLARTYDDLLRVMERAVADADGIVDVRFRDRALATACLRAARGMVFQRRWGDAWRNARRVWRLDRARRRDVLGLIPMAARRWVAGVLGR